MAHICSHLQGFFNMAHCPLLIQGYMTNSPGGESENPHLHGISNSPSPPVWVYQVRLEAFQRVLKIVTLNCTQSWTTYQGLVIKHVILGKLCSQVYLQERALVFYFRARYS